MNWHDFNSAALPDMPWKNGGGSTIELARWPMKAGLDDFIWRASIATIAVDGPFSTFDHVDRIITLIEGPGVHLKAADTGIGHALTQALQPYAFAGEAPIYCTAGGFTSRDFNIMTRRGQAAARVLALRQTASMPMPPHGLLLVTAGRWRVTGRDGLVRELQINEGGWWHGVEPDGLMALEAREANSSLLWVAIDIQGDRS